MRLSLLLVASVAAQQERSFTDDNGNTFTTTLDAPKIITWSHTAVTLSHYGLSSNQLLATYGEWINDGSDFDFTKPEAGSSFPADPTNAELDLLRAVDNLSPGCEETAGFCTEFDQDALEDYVDRLDFFVVQGYRQSPWAIADLIPNITAIIGEDKLVYTELSQVGDDCAEDNHVNCYGKSMIDVIEQYVELSEFLNLPRPTRLDQDLKALCSSAENFQKEMQKAHSKGIRAMPAYLTTETSYIASAKDDMVLRMMEELGAPIMHPGKCPDEELCPFDYFWEWLPLEQYFVSCNDGVVNTNCGKTPLYPVDVWLYDHRTKQVVQSPDFQAAFPDQAILKQQLAFWPIGGRLITPFHAAQILDLVGPEISGAERLHPTTECRANVDVTSESHRTSGLGGGEFACYQDEFHNSKYFQQCSSATANRVGWTLVLAVFLLVAW